MTFINLRKQQPEPELEDVAEETAPEDHADGEQRTAGEDPRIGFFGAFAAGVSGWLTWCSNRIGASWTYALHLVALWAAGYYSLWVTWGVFIGLALAINLFMPHKPFDRLVEGIERLDRRPKKEAAEKAVDDTPGDPLVSVMWQLIGEASGVHLKTLTEVLAKGAAEKGDRAPSKAEVVAALEARGIPIEKSVRDSRRRVNQGVHRAALKAWEEGLSQTEPAPPATGP